MRVKLPCRRARNRHLCFIFQPPILAIAYITTGPSHNYAVMLLSLDSPWSGISCVPSAIVSPRFRPLINYPINFLRTRSEAFFLAQQRKIVSHTNIERSKRNCIIFFLYSLILAFNLPANVARGSRKTQSPSKGKRTTSISSRNVCRLCWFS